MTTNKYRNEIIRLNRNKTQGEITEWIDCVTIALFIVCILFSFVFRIVAVDGQSMENTLHNNDRLIISGIGYKPKNSDIVIVVKPNSQNVAVIKRVIATEGQKVDIDFNRGIVYVDDIPIDEPYIKEKTTNKGNMKFPAVVPEGCVFVMGDNRNNSWDSRFTEPGALGMIEEKYLLGKALFRVMPLNKIGGLYK